MRTKLRSKITLLFLAFVLLLSMPALAFAQDAGAPDGGASPAPTIQSDKDDYPPGGLVTLTGANWQPGESVHINVDDDQTKTWEGNFDVTADENGNIRYEFNLPDWFVATYVVTATGESGSVAKTTFTDAKVDLRADLGDNQEWYLKYQLYKGLDCTGDLDGSDTKIGQKVSVVANPDLKKGSVKLWASDKTVHTSNTVAHETFDMWTQVESSATFQSTSQDNVFKDRLSQNPNGKGHWICVNNAGGTDRTFVANYKAPVVNQATSLSVEPASGTYGGTTALSATLKKTSDNSAVSNKTINFTLNGVSKGSATTNASGVATLSNASLSGINSGLYPAGANSGIGASFAAETGLSASNGSNSLTVTRANQTISFTSTAPSNAVVGDTYQPQATGGGSGNAVTFGASGACSYNVGTGLVTMNSDGSCSVTADQAGNTNYNAAPQVSQQFSVAPATRATETALARTAGANPSTYGDNVTFTATVTATGGNPNNQGNVTFKNGANAISGCSNVALSGNTAACTTSGLPVAGSPHSITAEYSGTSSGSPRFEQSTSSARSHSVDRKALTVSGLSAQDKVYNGNTNAQINGTPQLQGVISPDVVTLLGTASGSFANKNVASNKPVTVSGLSLSGAQAGNYSLSLPTDLTANITARDLTVSATGVNKPYDGNANATVNLSTDKLNGDAVTADYTSASFADKNVGTGKTVNVSGISISGDDASNYNLTNTATTTTANITALGITGTFTAADKVWDGNTSAQITSRDLTGKVNGDDVSLTGGTASFNNADVGQNKSVTGSGFSLAGADRGNYTLSSVANTTASITAWTPEGFYSPIGISNSFYKTKGEAVPAATSTTVWQSAKGGSTIPLKFNVSAGIEKKTNTDAVKGFGAVKLSTCSGSTLDPVEELATAGSSSLRYDATEGQFIQNWKTGTVSSDTCYRVTVTFQDDTAIHTFVRLRK